MTIGQIILIILFILLIGFSRHIHLKNADKKHTEAYWYTKILK